MAQFTTIEEMEADANLLRDMAKKAGAETWEDRKEAQGTQCKFGDSGVCCRICSMGPCRITPKSPRGLCGADEHAIAGRYYARMVAGGSSAHSDHGREVAHVLHVASRDGNYPIRDEEKLLALAKEWGVETEGRDIYDVAHEVAEVGLMEYGKPFGHQRFISRTTQERRDLWEKEGVTPRAVDREIATTMHMTTMGNTCDAEALVMQSVRNGLADGWGGSMMGTEFSDIIFGTPHPRDTEANLGVLEKDKANIIIHGHDPAMSEMIVTASEDREILEYARSKGVGGVNVAGLCCTANEIAMRHGIRMAGNFLQQENAIITGAVEAIVVDIQCIFPALGPLTKCYHTKFFTTSDIARIPGSEFIRFDPHNALDQAKDIVRQAIDNFANRDPDKILIPQNKQSGTIGYSCEAIIHRLDTVTNSQVDLTGTYKPLVECLESGVLRGAVGIVGCNNPKVRHDYSHIEIIKELIKNDIIVVTTGCSAQAAAKAGLLDKSAKELCGDGLKRVCELANIPPVLHMGSCVDISRILLLVSGVSEVWGVDIPDLPIVGCAPEWMSEKAVSIANYVIGTGLDTYLGVSPQVHGSEQMMDLITEGTRKKFGAGYIIEADPKVLVKSMIQGIEDKRTALGI